MDVNQDTKDYSVMRVTSFLGDKNCAYICFVKNSNFPFCFIMMFQNFYKNYYVRCINHHIPSQKNNGKTLSNSNKCSFIFKECSFGRYGKNCSTECGKCPDGNLCHHINGSCLQRLFNKNSKI